jgi:hypothetical protein
LSLAATVKAMAEAGCTAMQIAAVVAAHEDAEKVFKGEKRARDAERKRRSRHAMSEMSRGHDVTPSDSADKDSPSFPPSSSPPITPLTTTPNSSPSKNARERASLALEFENQFWPAYPHKVGKADALKSFERARKRSELAPMLDGLRRYIAGKPDDRAWCNPSTWLNQDRWLDQPASITSASNLPPGPIERPGQVFVKKDTEAWHAWQVYRGKTLPTTFSKDHKADGWVFPSEFPPEQQLGAA